MFKKILLVTALVVVIGVLVFGAVNRTLANNGNESSGQGWNTHTESTGTSVGAQGQGNGGNGRRGGAGLNLGGTGEHANLPPAGSGDLSAEKIRGSVVHAGRREVGSRCLCNPL